MEILTFLLAIAALIWAIRNHTKTEDLEEQQLRLQREHARLRNDVEAMRKSPSVQASPPVVAAATPPPPTPIVAPIERPIETPAAPPPAPQPPPPKPEPAAPKPPAPVPVQPATQARPKRRAPQPPPSPPLEPAASWKPGFDWEGLIGVKLFSWIAGIALVFAAIFFLRYSIEHGWLSPPIRMAIGLITGAGLLVLCEWRAARRYAVTANALDAAGIAILFSTFFAGHALWNLVGVIPTFVFMAMVTALAGLLSVRHNSMFVALLGLLGGFATPALLSTGEDRPIGLFSYLLLLNAGLAWVAYQKRWPILTGLSVVFTTLYQWFWVTEFLQAGRIPLALGIFMVFPILSFAAITLGERKTAGDDKGATFQQISAASAALPLFFAIYMAAIPAYGARYWLLFGFLFLIDAGLAAIAAKRGPEMLHLAGGLGTLLTLCLWLQLSYTTVAWPAILGIIAAFVLFYVAAGFGLRFKELGVRGVFAAPLLLVGFPILAAIEPAAASPLPFFGVLFILMSALASYAVMRGEGAVHFLAAFFALASEAVWSAKYLDSSRLIPALLTYAIFGLFYLGVPLAARRLKRPLEPEGSGAILVFASLGLLFFLAAGSVAPSALWGIALLIAILNLGLFAEAAAGQRLMGPMRPMLLFAGLVLSWIVIAVWWNTVPIAALLIPGLIVVGGFALLILAGNIWLAQRTDAGGDASVFGQGLYLALVGHAFLFFVVLQESLAVPPWPFLGVLAALDLAIGVAALYTRRSEMHLGALAASQIILIAWQLTVPTAPWPAVAVVCALAIAAMGFVWFLLGRKLEIPLLSGAGALLAVTSIAGSILGLAAVLVASLLPGTPGLPLLIAATAILVVLLLAIDHLTEWRLLAPLAVVPAACVLLSWSLSQFAPENWAHELLFAGVLYVLFLAYPLFLGERVKASIGPHLAAVMASVMYFLFARHSLMAGGFGGGIGLLPVTQAALLSGLLWKLTKLGPATERTTGRLALVAGAVLAFITVAIPLQLEKQWITIGWALLAAALAWLYRRIPHKGLLFWTSGLLAVVFVRLALNPAILAYYERSATPILNWYLYTYLVSAAAFFVTARLLRDGPVDGLPAIGPASATGGTLLLFLLLNIEIADFFSTGPRLTFLSVGLAQDLTYTIGWGLFAFGLLSAGILLGNRGSRVAAILLLSVTVGKCFLYDLRQLEGLYRIASLVGLAICLTLVALLLQRFVLRPQAR
jgi:uncharacterized membrane protein